MPYVTNSENDIKEMLQAIGVSDFEQLIKNIPAELRFHGELKIPKAVSELEITQLMEKLGKKNEPGISFMGGGAYDHYIPSVVDAIISRSEFYTSYTPYQPEVSQGTLQSIYEFQSMICELTGMDVTNASMYEAGSALAEAMLLACSYTKKNKVLLAGSLNPRYKAVLATYVKQNELELVDVPLLDFAVNIDSLKTMLQDDVAALIVQHPNYFGFLESIFDIQELLKSRKILFISVYDPVSLGILTPPGEYGADVAVAEGQSLGNRQNFGGPYLGLFSAKEELIRKMPGRIVGITNDVDGKRGFVLTLQTREQHIRREKATSNICTNSGLMAMAATVYLALMGKHGMHEVANLCLQKSHYLAEKLKEIKGVTLASSRPFFKEFTIKSEMPVNKLLSLLQQKNIFGGIDLSGRGYDNHLLIAVTEKRLKSEIDQYVDTLRNSIKPV